MNSVNIIGTITVDVELKYANSGTAISSFSIAWNENRKSKNGEWEQIGHFFNIIAFGKKAETIHKHFIVGDRIGVEGSLSYSGWVDKQGNKRNKVEIILRDFTFIEKKGKNKEKQRDSSPTLVVREKYNSSYDNSNEDEIPF